MPSITPFAFNGLPAHPRAKAGWYSHCTGFPRKRHSRRKKGPSMRLQSTPLRIAVLATLLICASGAASAQSQFDEQGFYVSAIAGAATYPSRPILELGEFTFSSVDSREHDFAGGFVGGYRFGRYFALEAGYLDLGEGRASMVEIAGNPLTTDLRFAAKGETLAAVFFLPIHKWEMYAKAGVLFHKAELRLNGMQSGMPFSLRGSANATSAYFDTGVSYRFDERWKASLGLAFFTDIGKEDITGTVDLRYSYL